MTTLRASRISSCVGIATHSGKGASDVDVAELLEHAEAIERAPVLEQGAVVGEAHDVDGLPRGDPPRGREPHHLALVRPAEAHAEAHLLAAAHDVLDPGLEV